MWSNLRELAPYLRDRRGTLAALVALTVATSAVGVFQPWPMKVLVDYAFGEVAPPAWVASLFMSMSVDPSPWVFITAAVVLTLAIFILNAAFDVALSYLWMSAGQGSVYRLSGDMYARMLRLSPASHRGRFLGDQLERLSTDAYCLYTILSKLLVSPLQRVLTIAGIAAISWSVDPLLTICSVGFSPVLALAVVRFGPILKRRAQARREAQSRLTQFVHQTFTSIPLVQAYDASWRNDRVFGELADDAVVASQRGVLAEQGLGLVNGGANAAGQALVLLVGSHRVLSGELTVGGLLLFIAYMRTLQQDWRELLELFAVWKTAEASLDRAIEPLTVDDPIRSPAAPKRLRSASGSGHVSFHDVSFSYDGRSPVLRQVSFEIGPGERVALVGPSGAGKSTLFQLLMRFHDVDTGEIRLDGVDLRHLELGELRDAVAYLPQEPFILPLTIRENLLYGRRGATRAELESAAAAGGMSEFVARLPHGWETHVGQRGGELSGGQKQRLATARCLLKGGRILLFDEPTAALDVDTEAALVDAVHAATDGVTTLTIAHRLSTVRRCDRILVLDRGRLVEQGTHQALLAAGGLYHDLVHASRIGSGLGSVADEVTT